MAADTDRARGSLRAARVADQAQLGVEWPRRERDEERCDEAQRGSQGPATATQATATHVDRRSGGLAHVAATAATGEAGHRSFSVHAGQRDRGALQMERPCTKRWRG